MKTLSEIKFEQIIKESFQGVLKRQGFKKKGNNFYRLFSDLGQVVNIQKSEFYSKDHIHFTVNTGIFIPEHWLGFFYNKGKKLPLFPTEAECLIRRRIGYFQGQYDRWYDIEEKTDQMALIDEMKESLETYILPYFEMLRSKQDVFNSISKGELKIEPLSLLIFYGEMKMVLEAKSEYERLLTEKKWNPSFLESIKQYGKKYNID